MRRLLRERLEAHIAQKIAPRAEAWAALQRALQDLDRHCVALAEDMVRASDLAQAITSQQSLASQRFTHEMTVHEAWRRHPGVAAIFSAHHLPACTDCAVGADETLAEAAFGYNLDLADLLAKLNALLPVPPDSAGP